MSTFFQAIHSLLQGNKSMQVLLTPSGSDEITISFIPVPVDAIKGDSAALLLKPFSLTGTPQELDEAFLGEMQKYAGARQSLQTQVEAEISIMDEAKKTSVTKTTKALTGKNGKPATGKATGENPSTSCDGEDEDEVVETGVNTASDSSASTTPAPVVPAQADLQNLFSV